MSKEIKTTIVDAAELDNYNDEGGFTFKHPSKFYVLTSLNQLVYIHVRSRAEAQAWADENWGKNFYIVRQAKMSSGSDSNYTCTGTTSRRGTASHLRPTV